MKETYWEREAEEVNGRERKRNKEKEKRRRRMLEGGKEVGRERRKGREPLSGAFL